MAPFMRQSGKIVEPHKPQTTIWGLCIACWIIKATATHSEYVIQYLVPFHGDYGYAEAARCQFLRCYWPRAARSQQQTNLFISPSEILHFFCTFTFT